jgi:hypothetical protein
MKGRRSFALTLLAPGVPGCTRDDVGVFGQRADGSEDDEPDQSAGDYWPEICAGSTVVEVTVDANFEGGWSWRPAVGRLMVRYHLESARSSSARR